MDDMNWRECLVRKKHGSISGNVEATSVYSVSYSILLRKKKIKMPRKCYQMTQQALITQVYYHGLYNTGAVASYF